MAHKIGIRREDKNLWERRTPLTPDHVEHLITRHDLEILVQPSPIRVFKDDQYAKAGAVVQEDLSNCDTVFAVKEIPESLFVTGKTYVYFSHTIKGQSENMPMLQALLDNGCQLIDYEKITDDKNRRLVFFGRHAGLAGMIDSLWTLGARLNEEGLSTPFADVELAHKYNSLDDAKDAVRTVGERIKTEGIPESLRPLVIGFAGYGNVSQGAQEISDLLPTEEISLDSLDDLFARTNPPGDRIFKVVFKEEHLVAPIGNEPFELQDYYDHPEKYRTAFDPYLSQLTVLINAVYWENRYPKIVTKNALKHAHAKGELRLKVIGDISCDVEGSIEANLRSTDPGNPVYVYDPASGTATDGIVGDGVVILATDNLPCELPKESSESFSDVLLGFIPAIASADTGADLTNSGLPGEIQRATIVWRGRLTGPFEYLLKKLE
jgi:alanine dehydrogenase